MPRKYIKKREPPTYTVLDVENAVRDVENKNMTLAQASSFYRVPKSTIYDRLGAKVKTGKFSVYLYPFCKFLASFNTLILVYVTQTCL